ncbi:MAG TPA: type III pantothenate kinase [Gammaproteobacteria bacterium]|nr:type III pantothenate kinase [Gammaproteobacteria bacterium]
MNLLIDIGNSRAKWAWWDGAELAGEGAPYSGGAIKAVFEQIGAGGASPDSIVAVSVAGAAVDAELAAWCVARFRLAPMMVKSQPAGYGITNGYARAERLGADRWTAMIGARQRTTDAVCVVDCGTAITLDFLDAAGRHRGGLIAPGIAAMRRALYKSAAGIADEGEGEQTPLATDTPSAVTAGTLYAAAAFVDRARAGMEQRVGASVRALITGGEATVLAPLLQGPFEAAPDLVLEGLAAIAREAQ